MPRGGHIEDDEFDDAISQDEGQDASVVPTMHRVKSKSKSGREGNDRIVLRLRACLSCHIVMSERQFVSMGCPNCPYLQLDGNRHAVADCTTSNFSGLIALLNPEKSWVARFNKLSKRNPGMYALIAHGSLPEAFTDGKPTYE